MGKDYRLGLIVGSILAGAALLWVATRPSLTPPPQPAPSTRDLKNENPAKADNHATLPGTSQAAPTGKSASNEPARATGGGSSRPTIHDTNTPAKAARVHIVRAGETLSGIAQQYYGSANAWRKILEANKTLKDANKIAPGTKLAIPD